MLRWQYRVSNQDHIVRLNRLRSWFGLRTARWHSYATVMILIFVLILQSIHLLFPRGDFSTAVFQTDMEQLIPQASIIQCNAGLRKYRSYNVFRWEEFTNKLLHSKHRTSCQVLGSEIAFDSSTWTSNNARNFQANYLTKCVVIWTEDRYNLIPKA